MPNELQKPLEWYLKDPLNTVTDVNLGLSTTEELQADMKNFKNQKFLGLTSTCGIYKIWDWFWKILFLPFIYIHLYILDLHNIEGAQITITCLDKRSSDLDEETYRGISITATLARLIP